MQQTAEIIPLSPEPEPVTQSPIAAHRPCPDMPHHSLTQADKERGLNNISRVRKQLLEGQLKPLREQANALRKQGRESENQREQIKIRRELEKIQRQAERIQERWT
ncbi:TPA: hypothetical protein ACPVYA_004304 [Vibrio parahaemolyticus]|uniref:hypothetical protein n=1 Tax=Vibrio parahaemolyticus TaxID=670 RepID=UPI0002A54F3F|nr:hypothetical protein [Vibrio parahaemolyticus]AGB11008.1 hypothetical protein VPBB_2552 [Vibrio parahaemolyticus BB22OP]